MSSSKRQIAALLIGTFLFSLSGCGRISIDYDGAAVLRYSEKQAWAADKKDVIQTLTEEETSSVKAFLSSGKHIPTEVGCPFTEDISIAFGGQVFAVAWDGCPTVRLTNSDNTHEYYKISEEGWDYITALFEKYTDYSE